MDIELKILFAQNAKNNALKVTSLPDAYEAWVIQYNDEYGVAIEVDPELKVNEGFASAYLRTTFMTLQNKSMNALLLTCRITELRMEFASICSQFLDPGIKGEARTELKADPLKWWKRWSQLLGNNLYMKQAYSVLGELCAVRYLLQQGKKVHWAGASGGTRDIEVQNENQDIEVKSTLIRYGETITISGQFQLRLIPDRELYLIFCRFEPSEAGESIETLVNDLKLLGYPEDTLERELEKCGLKAGSAARMETYSLLEKRKYHVDDAFPRITEQSFINGKYPDSISQISYSINLAGVTFEQLV
ncbi:PD-(D/E)XK motif protein [Paenibacillus catalpae]|uniref:PD-(D/E)XK motif protein n=1 Tax=Paenibacillus catalpae TaxID=1045775 RepID=UPI001586FB90|nr:PD-(D/E)XK motif protein [Paenibacillus catalpae]